MPLYLMVRDEGMHPRVRGTDVSVSLSLIDRTANPIGERIKQQWQMGRRFVSMKGHSGFAVSCGGTGTSSDRGSFGFQIRDKDDVTDGDRRWDESYTSSRKYFLYTRHKKFYYMHVRYMKHLESSLNLRSEIREFLKFENQLHVEVGTYLLETCIF